PQRFTEPEEFPAPHQAPSLEPDKPREPARTQAWREAMSIRHCLAVRINRLAGLASGEPRLRSECAIILALAMLLSSCAKPRPIKYYQITYPAGVPAAP